MKKLFLLIITSLLIFNSCKKESKPVRPLTSKEELFGSWVWSKGTTNTSSGKIVHHNYGEYLGDNVKAVYTLVFKSDGIVQGILESPGVSPWTDEGVFNIVDDTINIKWKSSKEWPTGKKEIYVCKISENNLSLEQEKKQIIEEYTKD